MTYKILARSFLLFGLFLFTPSVWSEAPRRIAWTGNPIRIDLVVGEERRITFPANIFIDLDPNLSDRLRTQINRKDLYWMAHEPFQVTRVIAKEEGGKNRVYLLDVRAVDSGNSQPRLIIRDGQDPHVSRFQPLDNRHSPDSSSIPIAQPGYVGLIRHAAQQIWAPQRLRGSAIPITRAAVSRGRVDLGLGRGVRTTSIASWRGGDLYVTAVKAQNRTSEPVLIDPKVVHGDWLAIGYQHRHLNPKGQENSTTTLYLVSKVPFKTAFRAGARRRR